MSSTTRLSCAIDHLVVTAPTLDAGARYVHAALNAESEPGGEHARMGTHNRLLKLGETLYLEIIAVNPAAPRPSRPRWFGLDLLAPDSPPRLATWVVRSPDIDASLAASGEMLGEVEPMTRGTLSWRITIPADGSLPFDGVMPSLIQWDTEEHPASRLQPTHCRVTRLEARHMHADRIRRALHTIGCNESLRITETFPGELPSLTAVIETPAGRWLLGPPVS